jgi:hypothetical protein
VIIERPHKHLKPHVEITNQSSCKHPKSNVYNQWRKIPKITIVKNQMTEAIDERFHEHIQPCPNRPFGKGLVNNCQECSTKSLKTIIQKSCEELKPKIMQTY